MIAGIDCQDKSDLPGSSASDWLQTKGCQYRRQCGRSIQYFIAKPEVLPFEPPSLLAWRPQASINHVGKLGSDSKNYIALDKM